jgi:quinol-cytochrome oxidoreductase complex cytochrome b subunit/cytochrome c551/c552
MRKLGNWLDTRLGRGSLWRLLFHRQVPVGLTWSYTLGSAALFVFVLQTITGILLALNYSPSPDHAYDSVLYISTSVPFGAVVRGLHHWGASAMVVLVVAHLLAAFWHGAYKRPREVTWLVGVVLLLITLGFSFTGYLLPWDQKAYWATTVGTNMPGTMPGLGPALVLLLRGGTELGAVTLSRFYAIHVLLLPALVGLFLLIHLALVIWHGVSVPAQLWHAGLRSRRGRAKAATAAPTAAPTPVPLSQVAPAGTPVNTELTLAADQDPLPAPTYARAAAGEDPELAAALDPLPATPLSAEAEHERYLAFKARGPRFWPEVIADDARAVLVVFLILVGLTVGFGVATEARADPTDTSYLPRPEWYFMFLFQFVKYFPGNLEWVGVLVVPGLFVLLLFGLPFLTQGAERRAWKRPLATGFAGLVLVGSGALTILAYQSTPPSVVVERGTTLTSQQLRGRQLINQQGCRACHIIAGEGIQKGPPLDGIGQRLTAGDIHFFIEKPKAFNPAASMEPAIPPLTHADVEAITQYLLTLDERCPMSATVADRSRPGPDPPTGGRLLLVALLVLAVAASAGLVLWSTDPRPLFDQNAVGNGSSLPPTTHEPVGGVPRARTGLIAGKDNHGQVLFGRYCDSCHTSGRAMIGPSLVTAQFKQNNPTGEKIIQLVRDGGFDMPAFPPALLSDEDLQAIVEYVLKLPQESP